jgi:hypothetical protein
MTPWLNSSSTSAPAKLRLFRCNAPQKMHHRVGPDDRGDKGTVPRDWDKSNSLTLQHIPQLKRGVLGSLSSVGVTMFQA